MNHTTVYRLYGHDGVLLYVGVASNPGRRFSQHSAEKPWWGEVSGCTLEHHAERQDALDAETAAILAETPRYNVRHGTAPRRVSPQRVIAPRPSRSRPAHDPLDDEPIYLVDEDELIVLDDDGIMTPYRRVDGPPSEYPNKETP